MYRIDESTAAGIKPDYPAASTEGFFTEGNPATGIPATVVSAAWLNTVQEELRQVVVDGGLTPDKADDTQLSQAIQAMIAAAVAAIPTPTHPPGFISGLYISNNSGDGDNDVDIGVGACRDAASAYDIASATAITKRLDAAWSAGSGNGGLFSGSKAASTTYHVFVIRKDADGTIDAGYDTSLDAANRPSGWTAYRRVGSVITSASSNIIRFTRVENYYSWNTPIVDVVAALPASNTLIAFTVPAGLSVQVRVNIWTNDYVLNGLTGTIWSPLAAKPAYPTLYVEAKGGYAYGPVEFATNTARQLYWQGDSGGSANYIENLGFFDMR